MNKIFHYGIILFIIVGLIFNKQEAMLKALLQTPFDVFELCKTLILSICLWNGLLKIIQASNMVNHLNFLFKPLLRWIYGRCIQDEQIYQALSSNLIANLLGLGTLATMSGLQAISKLKEKNKTLQKELDNIKELFEKIKNKINNLYHFFVDKMWGNKEKRDKYYPVAYELYGKNILDEEQIRGILGTKQRSTEIDRGSKSKNDDFEL